MTKPKLTTAAIVVALVFSGFLLSRNCGLTDKYQLARDDYNELAAITETDKKISDEKIQHLTNAIGQADETIVKKEEEITQKTEQIKVLSRDLAELIANEPSQPELESQPLVISLRNQVSKLTEMYSLSQQTITLQTEEIGLLRGKFDAAIAIGETWKQSYDKEHKLRLLSEGLTKRLESQYKVARIKGRVATVLCVVAGAYAGYRLLK